MRSFFLDIVNKKMYNIHRVGENIVSTEEYDVAGFEGNTPTDMTLVGAETHIANVNPFRYRGYYYDAEIELYYLQSRYYDPEIGRFINADACSDTRILISGNIFFYSDNNPINNIDSNGRFALGATVGTIFSIGISNSWNPVGWLALAAIAVGVAVCISVQVANKDSVSKVKVKEKKTVEERENVNTLPDIKARVPKDKVYRLAYINSLGFLKRIGKKMSFVEALGALGFTGVTNTLHQRLKYNAGISSDAQRKLQSYSKNWGIYTHSQFAAKALAVVLGFNHPPEYHGVGQYGHYHDSTGAFHIWYNGMIFK